MKLVRRYSKSKTMRNFFWKDSGSNYCNKQTDTFGLMQWHLKRRGMSVVWYGDKCHWKLMSSVITTSGPRHRCWGSWRTSSGWSWSRSGTRTATSYSTTSWTRQADTTRTSQSSGWKASSAKRDAVILCCQNLKTDLIEYWENNLIIRFWLSKGGNPSPASGFNLAPILKIHDFWGCVIEDSDKDLIYYKRCNLQSPSQAPAAGVVAGTREDSATSVSAASSTISRWGHL